MWYGIIEGQYCVINRFDKTSATYLLFDICSVNWEHLSGWFPYEITCTCMIWYSLCLHAIEVHCASLVTQIFFYGYLLFTLISGWFSTFPRGRLSALKLIIRYTVVNTDYNLNYVVCEWSSFAILQYFVIKKIPSLFYSRIIQLKNNIPSWSAEHSYQTPNVLWNLPKTKRQKL